MRELMSFLKGFNNYFLKFREGVKIKSVSISLASEQEPLLHFTRLPLPQFNFLSSAGSGSPSSPLQVCLLTFNISGKQGPAQW